MSSVFSKLSAVDCSAHVEKKGGLSYLSWAWAWSTLMQHYPDSTFALLPDKWEQDGTVMVSCTVTVSGITREIWLPVMDNRNNSIKNPTTRQISDARMRCLVKCIALHGLGLYIYAGEDLPEQIDTLISDAQRDEILSMLAEVDADVAAFCKIFKVSSVAEFRTSMLNKACDLIEKKRQKMEAGQ